MNYSRFIVGDKSGTTIAELSPDIGPINWRLNNVGKVTFSLAVTDPKAIKDNFRFGNRILVEFENGLPAWGGVIDVPRKWDKKKVFGTAYSAVHLFKYRITEKARYFPGEPAGAIFKLLIEEANAVEDTGVIVGDIYSGGSVHYPDYHYKNLLDIFQKSLINRLSTSDFYFEPAEMGGRIIFVANFFEKKGEDRTNIALVHGKNLKEIELTEQGPIINSWRLAGEGTGWGDERIITASDHVDSISLYGLRQGSKVYGDVSKQATLDTHADNLLDDSYAPYNVFSLAVSDTPPARFADYDLGDTIELIAPDFGFGGVKTNVRIVGRSYIPDLNYCDLVVQEVAE